MHRKLLLSQLENYSPEDANERKMHSHVVEFVSSTPTCFNREHSEGHITGSGWVTNKDFTKALLIQHKLYKRWFQPGGHADGESDILSVARREVIEETGLKHITPYTTEIFDIDVHEVSFPNLHLHYDIRFLFIADELEPIRFQEEEVDDARWISFEEILHFNDEESRKRMMRKTISLQK
ncbi:NUDIX hydrolase [Candidatus Dojkabacteria bacterium]|uniref:NUDIX hydrolase n=1 Tax=Candidatus Dojkabacteria bacterium TaxID=2099670 RepID=A0A955L855_9BACT|nr:NUDIX hydrolase [Candidatus Dojkabacteria bacterium]